MTGQVLRKAKASDTLCPVARSTLLVGDRWTILIIRELFAGCARFDEILAQTEATAQMLAARLKQMEAEGLIERRAYSQRPLRHEYLLTAMGRELYPIILAFRAWGETWCKRPDEPRAVHMIHRKCGTELGLDGRCPTCDELVAPSDMESRQDPEWAEERRQREAAHKEQIRLRAQKPSSRSSG